MTKLRDVFELAMSLMDELDEEGAAETTRTADYVRRTPGIVTALLAEMRTMCCLSGDWVRLTGLDDELADTDERYALGALPYGLAAGLLVDENPSSAAFFQQRYEEMRNLYLARLPVELELIESYYGGNEHCEYARW